MSGHVYYRFKSQKEFQRVLFDGIGISVWDLKREIITDSKMGKGTDFDFALYNADTEEEYKNDHAIVPRSSSVIARRLPPKRSGHGNAQQYVNSVPMASAPRPAPTHLSAPTPNPVPAPSAAVTPHVDWRGGGAISKDFRQQQQQQPQQPVPAVDPTRPIVAGNALDDEAASMAAMFAAQDQQWKQTQATMATATRVGRVFGFRGGAPARGSTGDRSKPREVVPELPHSIPPQGYICYRCGQKGHWIQNCPTNNDPEFEGRPRIKRTTGIPKSFLQRVESAVVQGQSVMVTADGSFVVARPDDASWKQHKSVVVKNLSVADIQSLRPTDPDLACSICSTLLKDAVKTSCCQSAFCHECISNHLKDHSSVCPECETKLSSHLSKALVADEERRTRSREYIEDLLRASKASQEESKETKADQADHSGEDKSGAVDTADVPKASENLTVLYSTNGASSTDNAEVVGDKTGHSQNNMMPSDEQLTQSSSPNSGADSGKSSGTTSATSASSNAPPPTQPPCQFDESANGSAHQFGGPGPMQNHMLHQMHGGPMGNNGMMGLMNGGSGISDNMEMPMMPGGPNGNHNAGMNSNHHMGMFMSNGHQNGGQGMNMGMMNSEEMLPIPIQMNKIVMMLQNPQLQQPLRLQLMMQHHNLQQMFMMQNMGSGPPPMNNHMSQRPAQMMQMNMMNGTMPSHMGQNSMMGHQGHQPTGTGPHRVRGGSNGFQSRTRGGRGVGQNHHTHDSSPYQRLPINGRRSNSNKRGRCEDLIELQSGEKVPRYM